MNIKLDDETYKIFEVAAKAVSKNGVKVPIVQLAESIINTELAGMDANKIAKRFIKSLMHQLANNSPDTEFNEEEDGKEEYAE